MVRAPIEKPNRIAGGFILVPVPWLIASWRACRSAPLGVGDFRTLLACREMVARRGTLRDDQEAAHGLAELARLLGVSRKRAAASVRRLVAAGLLEWSGGAIDFPAIPEAGPGSGSPSLEDTIGRGRGQLAIPRRILRVLAAGARPALVATMLGVLLRCLSRRRGGFDGRGRLKASWVANVFGVDVRRVKAARAELVSLGWIDPEVSGQTAENRWGRAYRINLAWSPGDGPGLPPLPPKERSPIATPSVDQDPLPERVKNQEPASGDRTGVRVQEQGSSSRDSGPDRPSPPSLDDVQVEDLRDVGRTLQLHDQAVRRKLADPSEAGRLRFVALAEHARAIGKANPGGLFAYLIRNGCWRYATLEDEDVARRKLREHDRGGSPPVPRPRSASLPASGLSEDARIVKAVRDATIRAGIFRDPWPIFHPRNPGWDRSRWDAALAFLGL